jgi:hypothetical protein
MMYEQGVRRTQAGLVRRFSSFAPAVFDLVAPAVVYFGLHALGVSDFLALAMGGFVTGMNAALSTIRRRRLDSVGALVVLEIAISIALLFVTGDPRILLLKPAVYVAAAALFMLASCFRGRPVTYEFNRVMAARGGPARLAAYEGAWDKSAEFRRVQRTIAGGWAVALALEAALRVVVVLSFSTQQVAQALVWSQAPAIVVIGLALLFTRMQVPTIRRLVDDQL